MRPQYATILFLLLAGCATKKTDYVEPPGFTPTDTVEVSMAPATFVEDGDRVVSASVVDRVKRRRAAGVAEDDPSTDPDDQGKLEVSFGEAYTDGTRVGISWRPRAWANFKPIGASPGATVVPRNDGSMVAYDGAYPGVVSAFGGTTRHLKEYLRAEQPGSAPELRYTVEAGPEFGELRAGDAGELWGYDVDGSALFAMPVPVVKDAAGTVVRGTWELSSEGGQTTVRAALSYEGLVYPLMIDPSFDTPLWVVDNANQPPARTGAAITWVRSRSEAVMFGGVGTSAAYLQDTRVRYKSSATSTAWRASDLGGTGKPSARAYAAMATQDSTSNVYMFGGHLEPGYPTDELWKLSLSDTAATWTQVAAPAVKNNTTNWPRARILHGMAALDDGNLLMFGGVDGQGNQLTDTWKWDGTTWTRLCPACFPALYGFATVPGRASKATRDAPVVFGGYQNGTFRNTVWRWNGTTWETPTIASALVPTLDDGTITPTPSVGTVSPQTRYLGYGFWSPTGNILLGGGFQSTAAGVDTYRNDLWSWESPKQTGGDRWVRQTSNLGLGAPGLRDTPSAIFFDSTDSGTITNGAPFGLLFGGATSASAGSALQSTRLYRGFNDAVTLTVAKRTFFFVPYYELTASTGFTTMQGYFVRRVNSQWELIPDCGTPDAPITPSAFGNFYCDVLATTANNSATAFGVMIRDSNYYVDTDNTSGGKCVQSTTTGTSVPNNALCGIKTAYPGQATCGVSGLSSTASCPAL